MNYYYDTEAIDFYYETVPEEIPFDWTDLPDYIRQAVEKSPWLSLHDINHYRPITDFDIDPCTSDDSILMFERVVQPEPYGHGFQPVWCYVPFLTHPFAHGNYILRKLAVLKNDKRRY
jgi:hypothetical protein